MNVAKQSGAKSVDEVKSQSNSFSGSGFQLGSASIPTKQVNKGPKEIRKTIAMWKNGFTLDDGPLRRYDDPSNTSFLDDVKRGVVPKEIQDSLKFEDSRSEISVELKDNRNDDYKEPPKVIAPFSGSGQKLGSTSAPSSSASKPTTSVSSSKLEDVKIDESQPTTSVQIRCADGSRLVGKFNLSHTVKDIRRFIDKSKGVVSNYDIFSSFPSKAISDESQTIQTAGLANSVVIQKPK